MLCSDCCLRSLAALRITRIIRTGSVIPNAVRDLKQFADSSVGWVFVSGEIISHLTFHIPH